jgi:hypothetical protein
MHQFMGVRAFVEAIPVYIPIGDGAVCGGGECDAGGWSCKGNGWAFGIIPGCDLGHPSILHSFDTPKTILWVPPPSEVGLSVEGNLTAVFEEEDFTPGVV